MQQTLFGSISHSSVLQISQRRVSKFIWFAKAGKSRPKRRPCIFSKSQTRHGRLDVQLRAKAASPLLSLYLSSLAMIDVLPVCVDDCAVAFNRLVTSWEDHGWVDRFIHASPGGLIAASKQNCLPGCKKPSMNSLFPCKVVLRAYTWCARINTLLVVPCLDVTIALSRTFPSLLALSRRNVFLQLANIYEVER